MSPSGVSSPCILFLVGMPAVGKTYWGNKIAEASGLKFIDLDDLVARRENDSIPSLFERFGETGFREREKAALHVAAQSMENVVIACGGGTPCYSDNMQCMRSAGAVIYMRAAIPLLLSHLLQSTHIRPLLQCDDPALALADLLNQRKNIYEQADYIVDAENLTLATFDKIIASCTNRH